MRLVERPLVYQFDYPSLRHLWQQYPYALIRLLLSFRIVYDPGMDFIQIPQFK